MSRLAKALILLWIISALMTMLGLAAVVGDIPYLTQAYTEPPYSQILRQILDVGMVATTVGLILFFFAVLFQNANAYAVVRREEGGRLEMDRSFFERLVMISLASYTMIDQPHVRIIIGKSKDGQDALSIVVEGDLDQDTNPDDFVEALRRDIGQNIRQAIDLEVSDISFRFRPLAKDPTVRRLL